MALKAEATYRKDRDSATPRKVEHRHLAFIAGVFRAERQWFSNGEPRHAWLQMIQAFAKHCARSNDKFDHNRFLIACGVYDPEKPDEEPAAPTSLPGR